MNINEKNRVFYDILKPWSAIFVQRNIIWIGPFHILRTIRKSGQFEISYQILLRVWVFTDLNLPLLPNLKSFEL